MENFKFSKNTSVPSLSRTNQNKCESASRSSLTHPSVESRSRDYLESLFKKINSGDKVLSRIPTRLDPNIEFSEDEDEPPTTVNKESVDEVFEGKDEDKKENLNKFLTESLKTPDIPRSLGPLFDRSSYTQEKKSPEAVRRYDSSLISKFSSASKVNSGQISCLQNRKSIHIAKDNSHILAKTNLKTVLQSSTADNKPFEAPNKNIIPQQPLDVKAPELANKNSSEAHNCNNSKNMYSLPSDIIEVNGKVYNVLSLLGSGGSCKVYSVYDVQSKSRVAIKRVSLKDTDPIIREGYKQEIEYLQKLQNSNRVIKLYDFEYRENELLLVLEHGDIDFAKYISNEAKLKRLTPLMIKFFWSQMLEAVADIHKYGIVHSDLKPANFLLVAGNLKLIDFGIATSVPEDKTSTFRDTQVGTLNYMSPEAITQMSNDGKRPCFKIGVKSDVWSLGCILYNLVYGVTPFYNIKTLMQKIYAITNPNYEIPFKPVSDPLLLDVLKSCLKRNPKERASVDELLKHPYLADESSSSLNAAPPVNVDLNNVLKQMQHLTPRRMQFVSKFVKELSEKTDT